MPFLTSAWGVGTAILPLYLLPMAFRMKTSFLGIKVRIGRLFCANINPPKFQWFTQVCHSGKSAWAWDIPGMSSPVLAPWFRPLCPTPPVWSPISLLL